MTERPDYWDDLDPEVRALIEKSIEEYPGLDPESPEYKAKLEAGLKAVEEYEREFGAFTEEEIAEADRIVERSLGIRPATRNTKRSA